MYLSGSQKIQKSMNGILRISASEIDAENAYITNINDVQTINGKVGENLVIDVDTGKVIQFKDNVTMDASLSVSTINNLSLINGAGAGDLIIDAGNPSQIVEFKNDVHMNSSLIVGFYLDVSDNAYFNSDISVSKNAEIYGMLDVSKSSIFRQNLVVNGTSNSIGIFQADSDINCFGRLRVTGTTLSQFDNSLSVVGNLHAGTFDVSNASIFNGSITCKGITSNGVCTFNNPIICNSSATFKNMIDVSTSSIFRQNLVVNGTFNSIGIGQFDNDINCFGRLRVTGATKSQIDNSLSILGSCDISGNLSIGKNNPIDTSTLDVAGTIYLRDPTNPNVVYMTMRYDPAQFGFTFTDETPGRIMNFKLKNTGPGYSLFYFSSGQLYASMMVYVDNFLTVSYNNNFVLGDSNSTLGGTFGVLQSFVPNNAVTSGHVTYVKGLQNNDTYYSNWVHVNTSNVDVPTMRISWQNIWSKVNHVMEANLTLSSSGVTFNDATVQTTAFTSAKNTKLTAIGGITTSTLNATSQLTTNTIYNCGSISLTAGTYIIQVNAAVDIITGSTVMNNMISAWSTSSTAFSQFLNTGRLDGGGFSYPVGCVWSLNSTDTITVASTTTYYMLVRVTFGTAARVRFVNPSSQFKATRVA